MTFWDHIEFFRNAALALILPRRSPGSAYLGKNLIKLEAAIQSVLDLRNGKSNFTHLSKHDPMRGLYILAIGWSHCNQADTAHTICGHICTILRAAAVQIDWDRGGIKYQVKPFKGMDVVRLETKAATFERGKKVLALLSDPQNGDAKLVLDALLQLATEAGPRTPALAVFVKGSGPKP